MSVSDEGNDRSGGSAFFFLSDSLILAMHQSPSKAASMATLSIPAEMVASTSGTSSAPSGSSNASTSMPESSSAGGGKISSKKAGKSRQRHRIIAACCGAVVTSLTSKYSPAAPQVTSWGDASSSVTDQVTICSQEEQRIGDAELAIKSSELMLIMCTD